MRIIKTKTLIDYWSKHPEVKEQLKAWIYDVEHTNWKTTHDVKERYPKADFLQNNRIVLNIKGNSYRLIVKVEYIRKHAYIKFIGTHSEYDIVDANTVDMY